MAKSAAQLLYGSVLVSRSDGKSGVQGLHLAGVQPVAGVPGGVEREEGAGHADDGDQAGALWPPRP